MGSSSEQCMTKYFTFVEHCIQSKTPVNFSCSCGCSRRHSEFPLPTGALHLQVGPWEDRKALKEDVVWVTTDHTGVWGWKGKIWFPRVCRTMKHSLPFLVPSLINLLSYLQHFLGIAVNKATCLSRYIQCILSGIHYRDFITSYSVMM